MKKLIAAIAAAMITLSMTIPAFAENENSVGSQASVENSVVSENTDDGTQKNVSFKEYTLSDIGMTIKLPENMYILTRDIDENDPALAACNLTKETVLKNFKASDTYIKASEKNFLYDITVTMVKNSDTSTIDNLTALSDDEVQGVIDNLLKQKIYTGCAKTKFNNTLFLALDLQYDSSNTKIYGIQEYTVIKGTKVVITFQSYNGEITDNQKSLLNEIMNSVTFEGISSEEQPSDSASISINSLDKRYIYMIIGSVIGVAALASIIILAMKYSSQNKKDKDNADKSSEQLPVLKETEENSEKENFELPEDKNIIQNDMVDLKDNNEQNDNVEDNNTEKHIKNEKTVGNQQEHIIPYFDEKISDDSQQADESKEESDYINSKIEEQQEAIVPPTNVDVEKKLSMDSLNEEKEIETVEENVLNEEKETNQSDELSEKISLEKEIKPITERSLEETGSDEEEIVFAESTPKHHTKIEQLHEEKENDIELTEKSEKEDTVVNNDEKELSAYEKRFGKNRIVPLELSGNTSNDEQKPLSKFEKHFGKITPVSADQVKSEEKLEVAEKSDKTEEKTEVAEKSDKAEEKIEVAEKSDKAEEKIEVAEKSDKAEEKIEVAEKSDKAEEKTEVAEKSDKAEEKTKVAEKSDKAEEKTEVAEKSDKTEELNKTKENLTEEELSMNNPNKLSLNDNNGYDEDDDEKKEGFFGKLKAKLFLEDEQNSTADELNYESEMNNETDSDNHSQNNLWNTIKNKLKNKSEESVKEDPEKTDNPEKEKIPDSNDVSDMPDKQQLSESKDSIKSENLQQKNNKKEELSDNKQIELEIQKNNNGDIVIEAIDEKNGKPLDIEIKNGESKQTDDIAVSKFEKLFGANREVNNGSVKSEIKPDDAEESEMSTFEMKFGRKKPAANITVPNVNPITTSVSAVTPAVSPIVKPLIPKTEIEVKKPVEEKTETEKDFFDGIKPVEDDIPKDTQNTETIKSKQNVPVSADTSKKEEIKADIKQSIADNKADVKKFDFERDTGIVFEHAIPSEQPFKTTVTPLTRIPRLESVKASVYNSQMEEFKKTMPQMKKTSSDFEKKFGVVQPSKPNPAQNQNKVDENIEFYTGYDDSADPFANETYQTEEMMMKSKEKKEHHKKGGKFMKSIGKLFSSDEDDEQ